MLQVRSMFGGLSLESVYANGMTLPPLQFNLEREIAYFLTHFKSQSHFEMRFSLDRQFAQRFFDKQIVRFMVAGFCGFVFIEVWLYVFSIKSTGINPIIILILGLEISIVLNFAINDYLTFSRNLSRFSRRKRFLIFQSTAIGSRFVNIAFFGFFLFYTNEYVSEFLAVCIAFLVNYELSRRITWLRSKERELKGSGN